MVNRYDTISNTKNRYNIITPSVIQTSPKSDTSSTPNINISTPKFNITNPILKDDTAISTQSVPDKTTPNIFGNLPSQILTLTPSKFIGAIDKSIQQKSLNPLKQDLTESIGEIFGTSEEKAIYAKTGKIPQSLQDKWINLGMGFAGGTGDISNRLAQTAAEDFAKQEAMKATKKTAVKEVPFQIKGEVKPTTSAPTVPKEKPLPVKQVGLETPKETAQLTLDLANKNLPSEKVGSIDSLDTIIAQTENKTTPMNQRVASWDYIRTPSKVLEKIGLTGTYRDLMKGYEAYTKELPKNIDKITAWSKEANSPGASERIFRYLDGEKITLDPVETKVAGEVKIWLSEWADRMGMKPDERISSYITHIFPFGKGGEIPEEIAFLIQKKIPGSVYNPFLLQRQGAEGYIKDTWKALDAYVKRATRKVNMDPALERLKVDSSKLTEASQLNYLNRYVSRINLRPTELDNIIDNGIKQMVGYTFGARPTASLTRFARIMVARAKIGGSITSWAKNLTQGVNTFSQLGTKYTLKGYMDLVRFGSEELKENGVLIAPFIEDRTYSAIKKAVERFDKVLFFNMTSSEFINRGAAYYGARAKALDEGKTMEQAVQYGKDIASKTQFLFGPLDTPVFMSSDIMRTTAQFQTFTIKQIEFIADMVKNYKQDWWKLMRYIASATLLFGTIGKAFGMDWKDVFPSVKFGTPPSLDFLIRTFNAITGAKNQYGQVPSVGARVRDVGSALFTDVVPAGAQIKRSVEGYGAVKQGKSTTAAGNLQYKIDPSISNYIKGTLFGKSYLPEAQQYYNKKANPKTKTKTNRYNIK